MYSTYLHSKTDLFQNSINNIQTNIFLQGKYNHHTTSFEQQLVKTYSISIKFATLKIRSPQKRSMRECNFQVIAQYSSSIEKVI